MLPEHYEHPAGHGVGDPRRRRPRVAGLLGLLRSACCGPVHFGTQVHCSSKRCDDVVNALLNFAQLVSNLLCAASVFSLDGFELVVSTLRAIPSYMRTLPETHNVATSTDKLSRPSKFDHALRFHCLPLSGFLRDIDVEGSPFEGVFETLSQEVLSPTTILHVLELVRCACIQCC